MCFIVPTVCSLVKWRCRVPGMNGQDESGFVVLRIDDDDVVVFVILFDWL